MKLNTFNLYSLAMELLSLDARIKIVAKQTGFSHKILRKIFVEMHHRSPSQGSLKTSPEFIYKNFQLIKHATLYTFFFRIENATDFCRRVINAYQRYSSYIRTNLKSEPLLDFSDAWVISEWFDSGVLKLVRCSHCRSAKLITNKLQHHVCCVCKS